MSKTELIEKYNIATPRYTSYPTVPYWENNLSGEQQWKELVKKSFDKTNDENGISIYIHLPYCENICTFCGCNKKITRNHQVETPYIDALLKEWSIYRSIFNDVANIKEIHLGGGTPTFFSSASLKRLIKGIVENSNLTDDYEFSIEIHPNVTEPEQLQTLYNLGFRRISLGIQDFDPEVQEIINRKQSFERVAFINEAARMIGFESINFDLIYGLPLQKEKSIIDTIEKVKQLMPDRIAFYSYAHTPWKSAGQRKFTENDLPSPEEKRKLYELGKDLLEQAGYVEIGMDHFALKSDSLYKSMIKKDLHRNFMGYTSGYTELLIGLGVSSISDTWNGYMQNNKVIEEYIASINSGKLPITTNHVLSDEDMMIRKHILNMMCNFETNFIENNLQENYPEIVKNKLKELEKDQLVNILTDKITVTESGQTFIRNICMAFDNKLKDNSQSQIFSKSI